MQITSTQVSNARSQKSQNIEEPTVAPMVITLSNKKSVIEHLDLSKYKTEKCPKEVCRTKKNCPFFHNGDDYRRDPAKFIYTPEFCEFGKNCLSRQKCLLSHNKFETNFHPLRYKKKYCKHILEINRCAYGKFCANGHNDQDIKVQLLHTMARNDDFYLFKFKTEFCPFQMEHNMRKCVYSHSWEDYRRDIMKTPYSKVLCNRWMSVSVGKLEYRCHEGLSCKLSHGCFESDFHPLNYKKYSCQFAECDMHICPFLHLDENPRFRILDQNKDFYVYPYNRILPSTYLEKASFFKVKSQNII